MTKIILFFLLPALEYSFLHHAAFVPRTKLAMTTKADDFLNKCVAEWDDLQKQLNKVKEAKDEEAAADLAEAMLEKALQTVSAKKYVEFEHEIDAKHRIKAASDLELMLEDQHLAAHKDAVGAQDEADLVESINANYEDEERHRDLSVVHAAHHIEQDTEKVLINAQHTANLAMDDLLGAEGTIMLLEEHEKALKQALDEFHHIKRDTYYDNLYKKYTSM